MQRGEVPPSPTCSSNRDSAHSSQDFSRNAPRRSQYRLFPPVLPTPPASPVTLQRASLTKASGSLRRRSSSVETAAKAAATTSLSPTATSPLSLHQLCSTRDARKASLPELPQLRTVQESAVTQRRPPSAMTFSPIDTTLDPSNSPATTASSILDRHGDATADAHDASFRTASPAFGVPLSPVVENPPNPGNSRVRAKAKPNLRINIVKGDASIVGRPASRENALQQGSQVSLTAATSDLTRPTTQTQTRVHPSTGKAEDLAMSPDTYRERQTRTPSDSVHNTIHGALVDKQRPGMPFSKHIPSVGSGVLATPRPQTSDGARRLHRDDPSLPRPSTATIDTPQLDFSGPQPRSKLRNRLLPTAFSRVRQEPAAVRPAKPPLPHQPSSNDWKSLNPPTPRSDRFAHADLSPDHHEHPVPLIPDTITKRPADRSDLDAAGHAASPDKSEIGADFPAFESYTPSAALAAARAQVAALRDSASSTASSNDRSRGLLGVGRTLSGRPPNQALPRPPSSTSADPVTSLKTLSEECDVLHARYATLKAERQKISSGIVTRLEQGNHGPDLASTLLDDQLSLAAVSSSMDICIAKLKLLECRKEEAIATLIARTTNQVQTTNTMDNISAVIASLALSRKPSTTPSLGSSHYAPTGRSTPDIGEYPRFTRASARTLSYGSEAESLDLRISLQSRKQSLSSVRGDSMDKTAPATIIEVTENLSDETASDSEMSRLYYQTIQDVSGNGNSHVGGAYHEDYDILDESSSSRASVDSDPLPEELFHDRVSRRRGDGKAAKVLGLIDGLGSGGLQTNLRLRDHDGEAASLLSVQTKNTAESSVYSDKLTSAEMEQQLQSFPRPKSSGSLLDDRRYTGGSSLTNGSSADSSAYEPSGEFDRAPRPAVKATDSAYPMKRRDPSAHTIKVFLQDDELLHYYNTMPRRI